MTSHDSHAGARLSRKQSPRRRIGTLALAFSVLLAAAPDAYGLGECPYHAHHDEQAASTSPATPGGHTGHAAGNRGGDDESGLPCTWFADCHLCVFAPPLHADGSSMDLDAAAEFTEKPTHTPSILLGPRRGLFELHRPNAPPLTPS